MSPLKTESFDHQTFCPFFFFEDGQTWTLIVSRWRSSVVRKSYFKKSLRYERVEEGKPHYQLMIRLISFRPQRGSVKTQPRANFVLTRLRVLSSSSLTVTSYPPSSGSFAKYKCLQIEPNIHPWANSMQSSSISRSSGLCQYRPLPEAESYIRLLQISQDAGTCRGKIPRCHVTTWHIDSVPRYRAISYTWGEPSPVEPVTIEGYVEGLMNVRQNLATVLRHLADCHSLMASDGPRYYWIDALCIDQESLEEKGHQVAMMGLIFKLAEEVLAFVGEQDDDVWYAMHILRHVQPMDKPSAWKSPLPKGIVNHDGKFEFPRYRTAMRQISKRSYFNRTWVVQELFLARKVSICCAGVAVSLEHFQAEIKAVQADARNTALYRANLNWDLPRLAGNTFAVNRDEKQCVAMLDGFWKKSLAVEDALRLFRGLHSQDRRDRIYGSLAIVDWELRTPISPDYSISAYGLALRILRQGLDHRLTLLLLQTLEIYPRSPELQRAIHQRKFMEGYSQRQNDPATALESAMPASSTPSDEMIVFEVSGRQIPREWEYWPKEGKIPGKSFSRRNPYQIQVRYTDFGVRGDVEHRIVIPRQTEPGDWVLDPFLYFTSHEIDREESQRRRYSNEWEKHGDGLVLRESESCFSTVGRARHTGVLPPTKRKSTMSRWHKGRFKVYFDCEDFLILSAIYETAGDGWEVDFPVCGTPASSFAEVLEVKRRRTQAVEDRITPWLLALARSVLTLWPLLFSC